MRSNKPKVMKAKYPGTCGKCGAPVAVGEIIVWNPKFKSTKHHDCVITTTIEVDARGREWRVTNLGTALM